MGVGAPDSPRAPYPYNWVDFRQKKSKKEVIIIVIILIIIIIYDGRQKRVTRS